ncbi:acyl carrier protein, partial [Kutzneria kofuensis]
DDLDAVLAELPGAPEVVVHALGMAPENGPDVAAEAERMFRTLLDLVQRAGSRPVGGRLPAVLVLTTGAVDVSGGEPLSPARAVLSAQLRSLAVESPGQRCRLVDCGPGTGVDDLVRELSAGWSDPVVARRRGRRWTPGSRPLRFDQPTAEPVRPAGAYVITGGLGGLGSVLARAIAGTGGRPKLALLSRRADSADGLRAELEAQGAEVRVIACDLADRARTDEALDSVLDRFGGITAVFHLAGVPGRQLMPVLDAADAAAVLRPKVAGTAALAHWLDRRAPGTPVVCFSSRAALTGMIGGADYAAANAFLDAFAAVRPGWLSINWPVWTEVGMAAGTRLDAARRPAADPAGDLVEETTLAASTCWAMDEHRVRGVAVLPGTAVVDLVIGAFLRTVPGAVAPVVLRDVVFQHPISGNQPRRVRVVFDRSDGPEWRVRVVSRPAEGDGEWRQHAVCAVAHADVTGRTVDVEPLRRTGTEKPVRRARPGGVLAFGPRWHNVGRAWESAEATLVEVELHPPYAAETTDHAVHPALLDTATGFLGGPTDDGFFAPFAYRTLTWLRPLPARLHSVLRPRQRSADSVVVDVDLVDPQGEVVVAVEGLTMRRTDARSFAADGGPDTKAPSPRPGLTPRDGIRLLFELLGHRVRGQVAVAPPDAGEPTESPAPPAPAPAGPEVPPDMPVGDRLRALWCEVLGRTDVTADSDFVDLGGDSLVAVALTGRIRDSFGVELGIGAVFEFPTLAELTDALVAQLDEQERT